MTSPDTDSATPAPQKKAGTLPPVLRPTRPQLQPLSELAALFASRVIGELGDAELNGITLATADLREGEVFLAAPGAHTHGANYAKAAADKGAVAIITDEDGVELAAGAGLPVIVVPAPREMLGEISAWVYDTGPDAEKPLLLGVTGTNGKTSVSHLLEGILGQLKITTGLSSTAERHIAGEKIVSRLTTPEASEMHALLALMRERGVAAVAVEVSAQALSRHRVSGIVFDVAGFTNLSHDHLDDYADMDEYLAAKQALFTPAHSKSAVVCLDSEAGIRVAAASEVPVTTVGTPAVASDPALASSADWVVEILAETPSGTVFELRGPEQRSLRTTVPVIGTHMAANAALAIVMALTAGFSWESLERALAGQTINAQLPGRTELISGPQAPAVYVDFGHSPDAFEKTLAAVAHVTEGKVVMLFGADGDRDTSKRFDMGAAAAAGSDYLIITDHHPRFEDPASIRAELLRGALSQQDPEKIFEVSPPEDAIVKAISLLNPGDSLLWAGPGHQDYRDIQGQRTPYSARELAQRALSAAGYQTSPRNWLNPYEED